MEHIAIDLGGRKSQVCVRDAGERIVFESSVPTSDLERFFTTRPPSRVVLETSSEAFRIAGAAMARGHEVRVVPATLVRALGVGARRTKTDLRDARVLSQGSCRSDLPSVHIPSPMARDLRARSTAREALVATRTGLINSTRGWLRQRGVRVKSESRDFPKKVRAAAQESLDGLPEYIEDLLQSIDTLNQRIKRADSELRKLAQENDVCRRMMSVPGVAELTAIRFWAALDDHHRFSSSHSVMAYLGLTPGENSSSERVRRLGITKAGPAPVRRVLVQAAHVVMRAKPHAPMCQWAAEIEKRRGKHVALVALARKMAGILFAIWRDGSVYDPTRAA